MSVRELLTKLREVGCELIAYSGNLLQVACERESLERGAELLTRAGVDFILTDRENLIEVRAEGDQIELSAGGTHGEIVVRGKRTRKTREVISDVLRDIVRWW